MALIREMPGGTLVGKMREQDCDFGISVNETTVEIGKAKEGLNVLDFSWYWPILDNLDFVWGHGEAFGCSIYPRYPQEVTWNSHLSAWAKSPLVRSCHDPFPELSHIVIPTSAPLGLLHCPLLGLLPGSVPTTTD